MPWSGRVIREKSFFGTVISELLKDPPFAAALLFLVYHHHIRLYCPSFRPLTGVMHSFLDYDGTELAGQRRHYAQFIPQL